VDMAIAGRSYRVACADGQEASLGEAGAMIAREADVLREQFGSQFNTLSEARVLLMAGLMLADRVKGGAKEAAPEAVVQVKNDPEGAEQQGLFEDPAQAARIEALEAELAAAREEAASAVAALEEAARQVREMTAELIEEDAA
ncbi:MAG: cell division protein ZapA, partial [Pseudomonadota bacterium]